jgi:hypothetical protein
MIIIIIFGLISNFNLYPLGPTLAYNGETYQCTGCGVISPYVYSSLSFLYRYSSPNVTFITLSPYVTFGYSDLLWDINKFPKHGSVSAGTLPEEAVNTVISLLKNGQNMIIPIYLTDKLSGRPGLKSFYKEPLNVLMTNSSMIYNNQYYSLFFSQ